MLNIIYKHFPSVGTLFAGGKFRVNFLSIFSSSDDDLCLFLLTILFLFILKKWHDSYRGNVWYLNVCSGSRPRKFSVSFWTFCFHYNFSTTHKIAQKWLFKIILCFIKIDSDDFYYSFGYKASISMVPQHVGDIFGTLFFCIFFYEKICGHQKLLDV